MATAPQSTAPHRVKAVLLDLDGTVYSDGALVPGVIDAIGGLAMGLDVPETQPFTPATAAAASLSHRPASRRFGLLSRDLASYLAPFLSGTGPADYVIASDSRELATYDRLNTAFRHVMAGAEILALLEFASTAPAERSTRRASAPRVRACRS